MNLLEEIRLLWSLKKVVTQMEAFLQKFDGLKTILGAVVVAVYFALPLFGVQPPHVVLTTGLSLAGVGIVHKFEKAFGIVSKILDWLKKGIDVAQAAVDALSAQ